MFNVGVLMAVYNRLESTKKALYYLYEVLKDYDVSVYILDDMSTDGTDAFLNTYYPEIAQIKGSGCLFWTGGMRKAWEFASTNYHDYYLLLNNDTFLLPKAKFEFESLVKSEKMYVLVGACRNETFDITYSGRTRDFSKCFPNGALQDIYFANGNVMFVPNIVFLEIGNLSSCYTHGIGDFDYSFRCRKAGIDVFLSTEPVAICSENNYDVDKVFLEKKFVWRFINLNNPKLIPIFEYTYFKFKVNGLLCILDFIKVLVRVLFPRIHQFYKGGWSWKS